MPIVEAGYSYQWRREGSGARDCKAFKWPYTCRKFFILIEMPPLESAAGDACPPSPPPAATDSYRPIVRFLLFCCAEVSNSLVPKCPVSRHFGNGLRLKLGAEVSKWFGAEVSGHFGTRFSLILVPKCLSALVPKCLGAEVSCGRSVRLPAKQCAMYTSNQWCISKSEKKGGGIHFRCTFSTFQRL